jgi:[acyl-carrier-protein] S-malonyltransferase
MRLGWWRDALKPRPVWRSGSAEVVEAANFNDSAQTVIAGSKAAVDKACEVLKARGAKRALPLAVSAPFHSSLMKPAAEKLREKLAGIELGDARHSRHQQHRREG